MTKRGDQRRPRSLNVALEPSERLGIERLHERLRRQDPIKYRAMSDILRDTLRERLTREFGPDWEAHIPATEAA